jgi:hypothetical protein
MDRDSVSLIEEYLPDTNMLNCFFLFGAPKDFPSWTAHHATESLG